MDSGMTGFTSTTRDDFSDLHEDFKQMLEDRISGNITLSAFDELIHKLIKTISDENKRWE